MKWGEPLPVTTRDEWREWLQRNHGSQSEAFLAHFKKSSTKPGIRYNEAVEEALSFGWIDGIARHLDGDRSLARFTPRRKGSNWSESNRNRVRHLGDERRMHPADLAAMPEELFEELRNEALKRRPATGEQSARAGTSEQSGPDGDC